MKRIIVVALLSLVMLVGCGKDESDMSLNCYYQNTFKFPNLRGSKVQLSELLHYRYFIILLVFSSQKNFQRIWIGLQLIIPFR